MSAASATKEQSAKEDDGEIVKWYTRARKFPQLIGKTPDGTKIWGGPYTYTQVIVGVLIVVVGSKTTSLWGHFGTVGNILLLLGVAYGTVILIGRLPLGSRNPLSVGAGFLRAWSAPAKGRLGGSPVRMRKPHTAHSQLVLTPTPSTTPAPEAFTPPTAPVTAEPSKRARRLPRLRWSRPAQEVALPVSTAAPALSGVQKLLASTGPAERSN